MTPRRPTAADIESCPAGVDVPEAVAGYDRRARWYDVWAGLSETKSRRRALEIAGLRDGEAALEVAVGTGLAFSKLLASNPHGVTVGIDASSGMLERARRRTASESNNSILLIQGDCRRLPVPDESFDLVFCAYLLDLLSTEDMHQTAAEMRRVLRPGGRVVSVSMTGVGLFSRVWNRIYAIRPALLGGCRPVYAVSLLESAGFVGVTRQVVTQFGFQSEVVAASRPREGLPGSRR